VGRVPHDGAEGARVAARPRGDTQDISSDQDSRADLWVERRKAAGGLFLFVYFTVWLVDKLWHDRPAIYEVPAVILFVGSGLAWAALAIVAWRARRDEPRVDPEPER
jgi:hypothetical protein